LLGRQSDGGAILIILDPIVMAIAADSHKNAETRRGLQPLVDLSAELGAALLGVTHLSKGTEGRSPIDRVTGSLAFGALSRVVMIAAKRQHEYGKSGARILMLAKSNLGVDEGGFEYELQSTPLFSNPEIVASVVAWGNVIEGNARDVLAEAEGVKDDAAEGERTAFREAKDFLLDFLTNGPRQANDAYAAGHKAGHSQRTIKRAKAELKISSSKIGEGGTWVWSLPNSKPLASLEPLEPLKEIQTLTGPFEACQSSSLGPREKDFGTLRNPQQNQDGKPKEGQGGQCIVQETFDLIGDEGFA
jgi:putative DNA primase/helicase